LSIPLLNLASSWFVIEERNHGYLFPAKGRLKHPGAMIWLGAREEPILCIYSSSQVR